MAGDAARKQASYQDVLDAPETMVAEILDGELHLQARPRRRHARSASTMGAFLLNAFDLGVGGPGGWTILDEPELHFGQDVLVPDIAGWRDGRLVDRDGMDEPFIVEVPDWVCEVASPGTARIDRMKKVPIHRREGVRHVWLADPVQQTVEVLRLTGAEYILVGTFGGDMPVSLEPFAEVPLEPVHLWGRGSRPRPER